MMRKTVIAAAVIGGTLCTPQVNAKEANTETLYEEALECRLAAQSVLMALSKSEPENEEQAETLRTVESTESFYHKLSLLLGRKLGKRESIIGLDFANLQLDLAASILTKPNGMAGMINKTKTCGEAISEAEKA